MIIICEECGKKYRVDPLKIKGETAKFRCKACNHILKVTKPVQKIEEPVSLSTDGQSQNSPSFSIPDPKEHLDNDTIKSKPHIDIAKRRFKVGLRSKMVVLFFIVPLLFFTIAGFLYLRQVQTLTSLLTNESTQIVRTMSQDKLADNSRAVAAQCRLYLLSHPGLRKEEFNQDVNFKRLSVQKVGLTGYTALYERPGADGIWRTWAHPADNIIGIDMNTIKSSLKGNFSKFWKIFTGVKEGRESSGYYNWKDKDGKVREKFMVCTPIEGTRFVIAATTYRDELIQPVNNLKKRSDDLSLQTRNTIIAILSITLFVTGLIVSIYGHRLTSKIKTLTDVADRISVGELEAEIPVSAKDEIGDLAEAISRMQDSIRLSIERLRKRR